MMTQKGLVDSNQARSSLDRTQVRYTVEAILAKSELQLEQNLTCAGYSLPATGQFGGDNYNIALSANSGSPVTLDIDIDLGNGETKNYSSEIKMYQAPLDILVDVTADAYIEQDNQNRKNGAQDKLHQKSPFLGFRRSLLYFDLSALTIVGNQVESANMELYLVGSPDTNTEEIGIYAVVQNWIESQVTWSKWNNGAGWWLNSGGDFDPTEITQTLVDESNPGLYSWDISGLTRDWLDAVKPNNGIILRNSSINSNNLEFASREYSDTSKRPVLRIKYKCECGQVCP